LAEARKIEEDEFKNSSFEENSGKKIYTVSHRGLNHIFKTAMAPGEPSVPGDHRYQ
jgi:hypothetical protein